jgi:DNA mismatch repair protein MutS
MGSFVPADTARLPVVDRVFTRVGASDDIAGGQSTFMREMTELTSILHGATPDSLVLLDEVGRGTSTADGRAIARATAEFLHDEVGATTLFATHYHGLTGLADEYARVRNLHFAAEREEPPAAGSRPADDDVTFLHRVAAGPASSSYGVDVARMAGVPDPVVERSRALVADADPGTNGHEAGGRVTLDGGGTDGPGVERSDAAADAGASADVAETLRDADLARTTPIEALNLLADLKDRVEEP